MSFEFKYEQLESTFHHNDKKSEPAIYASMAGCINSECLEVHEWIAICDETDELIREFKKEAKRFLLNKANWLPHGDFRNDEFKPFTTNLSIPENRSGLGTTDQPIIMDQSNLSGQD